MIGQTLGRYRIVEKLGEGGMGEVYRARDEELKRDVAIKVLRADTLTDDRARKHFRKEAETLSKLNHPHIAQVYDFGSQDELDFLVMEEAPGESLKDKLDKGSLLEKEVVRLGSQIADALQEAHEHGIVHRDLKPGNVKLTIKGQAKVLDFGIAKFLQTATEATTQTFTGTHALAGTLPYMSPEQLKGEPVDGRSDLYSFGISLYEMATGQRPFQEKLSTALSDAILHQPPPAPRVANPRLSPELERIILKCLEKDPDNRYQSAKELAVDLRRLTASPAMTLPSPQAPAWGRIVSRWLGPSGPKWIVAVGLVGIAVLVTALLVLNRAGVRHQLLGQPVAPRIDSLAVLPLENRSGDSEQEYFVEGMHEALITELSKIGALKVISRTSTIRYKGTDKPLPQIARELNVDAVVEGSVLRVGDRVRVTAQLIDAATDEHLWAENYDRDLRDVLALHSDVARAIARQIQVAVTPDEESRLAINRSVDPEAHEAYLKGRYFWNKRTEEALKTSLEHFGRAIEKDPNYVAAYAGLADSYLHLAHYSGFPPREAMAKSEAAILKALEIDPQLAEAHASLGHLRMHRWDWSGSETAFKRAIELNPNYAVVRYWYAGLLSQLGRHPEALAESDRAMELDPLSLIISERAGARRYEARQYDAAIEQFKRTLAMDSNFVAARQSLGLAYAQKGLYDEALAELTEASNLPGAGARGAAFLAYGYAVSGKRRQASRIVKELQEQPGPGRLPSYEIAAVYAALGDKDQAFAWLDKAHLERDSWLVFLKVEPMFDPLHNDPRFQSLLRRLNFPE